MEPAWQVHRYEVDQLPRVCDLKTEKQINNWIIHLYYVLNLYWTDFCVIKKNREYNKFNGVITILNNTPAVYFLYRQPRPI